MRGAFTGADEDRPGLCAVVVLGSAQRLGMTPGVLPAPLVGRFAMEGQVVLSISAAIALGGLALSAHSLARRLNQADRYYGLAVASPLPTRSASLSPREAQIVAAVAAGYISDRELAEHLHIAPSTAATHVRNIMRKAGLSDRRLLSTLVAG